jgi:hypothetical protein
MNPNQFYTPVAPGDLTVNFVPAANQADVQWQAAAGNVTGYQVEKTYEGHGGNFDTVYSTSDFNVSASTLSLNDDVSGQTSDEYFPFQAFNDFYKVRAKYNNGQYSAWSDKTPLKTSFLSASLVYGANGQAFLTVSGVPANTSKIRLFYFDNDADSFGNTPINFSNDIPYSLFTNGLYALPDSLQPPAQDTYGYADWGYDVFAQTVDANSNATDYVWFYQGNGWKQPFYDGRVQLKKNLIFKLRAADMDKPFRFYYSDSTAYYDYVQELYAPPTNYVESSLLHVTDTLYDTNYLNPYDYYAFHGTLIDPQYPFFENYLFNNFAASSANVDGNGLLDTGVGSWYDTDMQLSSTPLWKFQAPSGNWTSVAGLLNTSATSWLCSLPDSGGFTTYSQLYENDISDNGDGSFSLASGAKNFYGLALSIEKIAGHDWSSGSISYNLSPGNTSPQYSFDAGPMFYAGTTQPQLQTVEYDFWSPIPAWNPILGRYVENWLPGSQNFSTASQSQQFIVPVGTSVSIAGYAKMTLQNGYSGVYAYLGQYFDQAYKVDTNGVVTTTSTGVLSPYGNFFATEAGRAALVTMPDVDTGQRGTNIVYCVSLNVDKNHDGTMDTSFTGPDTTSQASPMDFWINDDCDWSSYANDPGFDKMVQPVNPGFYWDYQYYAPRSIRDLEDYARLWICGVPALTNAGYQVTMSWSNVSGNPAVNLIRSCETNGGIGYLTATNIAWQQISSAYSTKYHVTANMTLTLPVSWFTNYGNKYLLFEGAGVGSGQLVMTISQNGNIIAQTGAWMDLHEIKDFYEAAVITNNMSNAKSNWTSTVETVVNPQIPRAGDDTNLIVMVHGINVDNWHWINASETVYKRLYWAGFNGRFATVEWPCNLLTPIPSPLSPANFNDSELQGYKASIALTNYFSQLRIRFPGYRFNILAHSQGNTVVSEAIKKGLAFDTYILTQGALPDSAYDANAPIDSDMASYEGSRRTPELQPMGYRGAYTNFTGRIVNFYNPQDGVLAIWVTDQELLKPSIYFDTSYYYFDGVNSYYDPVIGANYLVTDSEEARADVSRSRTLPIGQSGPESAHGVIASAVNLNAQFNFNDATDEHSAQWTRPIQTSRPYFQQVLRSCQIQPAP